MCCPGQRDQHSHSRSRATIEKPAWRHVINSDQVQSDLAHQRKIDIHLFWLAEIISVRVRFERTVGDAFDEKLAVAVEKEFRNWSNSRGNGFCHVVSGFVILSEAKNL